MQSVDLFQVTWTSLSLLLPYLESPRAGSVFQLSPSSRFGQHWCNRLVLYPRRWMGGLIFNRSLFTISIQNARSASEKPLAMCVPLKAYPVSYPPVFPASARCSLPPEPSLCGLFWLKGESRKISSRPTKAQSTWVLSDLFSVRGTRKT